jgi:hypothetical protein
MILRIFAHFVGFIVGSIAGIVTMIPIIVGLLCLCSKIQSTEKIKNGLGVLLLFISSFLSGLIMVFVSTFIVGLFKTEPSWILVLVYFIFLWLARNYRYPNRKMNYAFNIGTICGLISGGILFLQ